MSNAKWNLASVRKIAGLPLNESWDRDDFDDEDPDVKIAMGDKRQKEFEKRNSGELSAAQKALADKKKAQQAAAAEKKTAEKKEPEKKAEEKKVVNKPEDKEATPEAKRRGKAPNENSKAQRAKSWIENNKSAKRGEFLRWAKENLDMGAAYASAFFARHNPKGSRQQVTNECWVLTHPSMPSFLLAENRELNQMQWVDPSSPLEPMIFASLKEAERTSKYMAEWKSQFSNIEAIVLED